MNIFQSSKLKEHKALLAYDQYQPDNVYGLLGVPYVIEDAVVYKAKVDTIPANNPPSTSPAYWEVAFSFTQSTTTSLLDTDGDTGIEVERTPDDDIIRFKTAGVGRMVINNLGDTIRTNNDRVNTTNISTGTSSPSSGIFRYDKLVAQTGSEKFSAIRDVFYRNHPTQGTTKSWQRFDGSGNFTGTLMYYNDFTGWTFNITDDPTNTNTKQAFRIKSNGDIAFNASYNKPSLTYLDLYNVNTAPSAGTNIRTVVSDSSGSGLATYNIVSKQGLWSFGNNDSNGRISLTTGGQHRVYITTDGLVGIGTVTPSADTKLHIRDDNANTNEARAIVQTTDQKLMLGSRWKAGVENYSYIDSTNNAENSPRHLVLLRNGGYVGIGTTNPTERLEVAGNILLKDGAVDGANLGFSSDGNSTFYLDNNGSFRIYESGLERIVINPGTGNMGIGTLSSPALDAKLVVNGFTRLGTDAPKIKMKKLTVTTGANQGSSVDVLHGLDFTKIIAIDAIINNSNNVLLKSNDTSTAGGRFSLRTTSTFVRVTLWNNRSSTLTSRPATILITYEE